MRGREPAASWRTLRGVQQKHGPQHTRTAPATVTQPTSILKSTSEGICGRTLLVGADPADRGGWPAASWRSRRGAQHKAA